MGTLGRRGAREPHLVPRPELLRSQHDNQSWLAALTAILDTSALVVSGVGGGGRRPGSPSRWAGTWSWTWPRSVYAPPVEPATDRLPPGRLAALGHLGEAGLELRGGEDVEAG